MKRQTLEEILASPRLPSLPVVAMQVLEVTQRPEVDLQEVAMLVRNDQALASKILRTVNSSFYSLSKPCTTIHDAMVYLGLNTVKTLVLGFGLVDGVTADDDNSAFNYPAYWRAGLYSAVAAREIAGREKSNDPELAFLAGLMQDVGMVVLYRVFGEEYIKLIKEAAGDHRRLAELEEKQLHLDHATVGAQLAERWQLPEMLVQVLQFHHDSQAIDEQWRPLTRIVELSAMASSSVLLRRDADRADFKRCAEEWLGYGGEEAESMLEGIAESASQLAAQFRLDNVEEAPDVDHLLQEAEEQLIQHQIALEREAEQLKVSNVELARRATTDPLTGLFNRMHFDQFLVDCYQAARQSKGCMGLIFSDVDKFKSVNDTHGHQVGDVVLAAVARVLVNCTGELGAVCRYGGEEFAIIAPGLERVETTRLAEHIRKAVAAEEIDLSGVPDAQPSIKVTISLGVASYEPDTAATVGSPDVLVRIADQAVYIAKESGRDCVRVFAPVGQPKVTA